MRKPQTQKVRRRIPTLLSAWFLYRHMRDEGHTVAHSIGQSLKGLYFLLIHRWINWRISLAKGRTQSNACLNRKSKADLKLIVQRNQKAGAVEADAANLAQELQESNLAQNLQGEKGND